MKIGCCTKCKRLDEYKEQLLQCVVCGADMIYLGVDLDIWNSLGDDEMIDIIENKIDEYKFSRASSFIKQPTAYTAFASQEVKKTMKAIRCEMCNSNDVIKQDGLFVCQCCGTKYSIEEAKKMMLEGSIDVSGSLVKIDDTDHIMNLYDLARRAYKADNYSDAKQYYTEIARCNANDWEAYFYSVICGLLNCKIADISNSVHIMKKTVGPTFDMIKSYLPTDLQRAAYADVANQCIKAARLFSLNSRGIDGNTVGYESSNLLYTCGKKIDSYWNDRVTSSAVYRVLLDEFRPYFSVGDVTELKKLINYQNTHNRKRGLWTGIFD